MIGLLQKVSQASVTVDNKVVAAIGRGLLVLVAVEKDDTSAQAKRLAERLLGYRVFPDGEKPCAGTTPRCSRGGSAPT